GIAFFLYLVMLGLCLRYLARPTLPAPGRLSLSLVPAKFIQLSVRGLPEPPTLPNGSSRVIVTGAVLLLILAITVSHQFTPLVAVLALGILAVLRRVSFGIFLFAGVMVALWVLYAAVPFVAVALPGEFRQFGLAVGHFSSNLADISLVSPGQAFIALICRL